MLAQTMLLRAIGLCFLGLAQTATLCAAPAATTATPEIDQQLKPAVDQFLRREETYTIDLGQILVCAAPATISRFSTLSFSHLWDQNYRHRAIIESVYRQKYLPLRDAGYIDIADGPTISEPQVVWEPRPVPAPAKRIACSRARYVVVKATEKARAVDPDRQPGPAQKYLTLQAGRLSLTRLVRDEIVQLTKRYRVVEFEFAAEWNPLYLRIVHALGHRKPKAKLKTILVFASDPGTNQITAIAGETADIDKQYKQMNDVRGFLVRREIRPNIKY